MNVRVKICGITNSEDALAAVAAGADALGFVFYKDSPRYLEPERAAQIIRSLPPFVAKAGLFVNAPEEFIRKAIETARLDTLQLHGDETPAFCDRFQLKIIKAFRIQNEDSLSHCSNYPDAAWLLDSYVPGKLGGTGATFNWELAHRAATLTPHLILAGGLTPGNVQDAVHQVQPYAVDVSSGVELHPGKKDHQKMEEFIRKAKGVKISPLAAVE